MVPATMAGIMAPTTNEDSVTTARPGSSIGSITASPLQESAPIRVQCQPRRRAAAPARNGPLIAPKANTAHWPAAAQVPNSR